MSFTLKIPPVIGNIKRKQNKADFFTTSEGKILPIKQNKHLFLQNQFYFHFVSMAQKWQKKEQSTSTAIILMITFTRKYFYIFYWD